MSNNPTQKKEWQKLQQLAEDFKGTTLNDLFDQDSARFENFSIHQNGLLFDYSKQRVTQEIIGKLCDLSKACGLDEQRQAMFDGERINTTEDRDVLHTTQRDPTNEAARYILSRMKSFSNDMRLGKVLGATDKAIKTVVNLGVGGSDLGPRLICEALKSKDDPINVLFVSNIDGADLRRTLEKCDAESTLFIVSSKSFSTQETMANARSTKLWLKNELGNQAEIYKHFVGISSNTNAVKEFGISNDYSFPINEGVNGRFSLWSAIGLPICLQFGFQVFEKLLQGAYEMDQHFLIAKPEHNMPVLLAMIGIWNRNFLGTNHHAVIPYTTRLSLLPTYLQQLEMESNGKCVDKNGKKINNYKTSPIVFGESGTNSQHSFFQLLHQGHEIVPADFIGFRVSKEDHHYLLMSNMIAQSMALMKGRNHNTEPHKSFEGNRPSSTFIFDELNPHSLGKLIALYEHKTFVQGIVWNINSFDQFGVELGKELAHQIDNNDLNDADASTKGLYSYIHKANK